MIKIRRNAFKKISSILSTAKGVISCTSWAQIDDSHETQYSVSTPEEALEWLHENQAKARAYTWTETSWLFAVLTISLTLSPLISMKRNFSPPLPAW